MDKKDYLTIGILGAAVFLGLVLYGVGTKVPVLGSIIRSSGDAFGNGATNTSVNINTTSTLALAANQSRSYARISNEGATRVHCSLNTTGATTTQGLVLNASSTASGSNYIELGSNFIPYYGPVYCIGTSTLIVVEN